MARLIHMTDIREFGKAGTIPEAAITDHVLCRVAELEERGQVEPWLRALLHAPDATPHGPTEIADILTTHLTIGGRRRLAAFVVKGRATPNVTSKAVGYQFLKLRTLPGLDLVCLFAVGSIQDDAQRDFIRIAQDIGCDFLLVDRQDAARLFVAYGMICPLDGASFVDGLCEEGHVQTPEIELQYPVRERPDLQVVSVKDASHGTARRLSANILVDPHYPSEILRDLVRAAVDQVRVQPYYASAQIRERWEGTPAHVVWVYVAADLEDVAHSNWLCRACWIDPALPVTHRPHWETPEDPEDDLRMVWNSNYHEMKALLQRASGSKGEVLDTVERLLSAALCLLAEVRAAFDAYRAGSIAEEDLIVVIGGTSDAADRLYFAAGKAPVPPLECREYEQCFQCIMADFHNLWLYYTSPAFLDRDSENRAWLFRNSLTNIGSLLARLEHERDRLHRG